MIERESRRWRVVVRRADVLMLRGIEARSEEEAEDRARETLGQHDDLEFLDDRDESFEVEPEG